MSNSVDELGHTFTPVDADSREHAEADVTRAVANRRLRSRSSSTRFAIAAKRRRADASVRFDMFRSGRSDSDSSTTTESPAGWRGDPEHEALRRSGY